MIIGIYYIRGILLLIGLSFCYYTYVPVGAMLGLKQGQFYIKIGNSLVVET
jgi:hypothetical protein